MAVARAQAQGAADLAALTAAYSARDELVLAASSSSGADPCSLAHEVARQNGAGLSDCAVDARGAVRVRVVSTTAWGDVTASARAGPTA